MNQPNVGIIEIELTGGGPGDGNRYGAPSCVCRIDVWHACWLYHYYRTYPQRTTAEGLVVFQFVSRSKP